jgi:sugar phosphate isomerase/epimerase
MEYDAGETAGNLDRLCRMAGDFGIRMAWENVSWCMSSSPEFINKVILNMKEKIYFTLDVKQAVRNNMSPLDYLDIYKDRIINFHISDSKQNESCLLPGRGDLDLPSIIKGVGDLNAQVPYIIEIYKENYSSVEQIEESRKYLEGLR